MATSLRREKWPRRPKNAAAAEQGNLEALFGQERPFSYPVPPVVLLNSGEREEEGGIHGIWEEKWRFQGEVLRAECKFLRMEKQIAVKRLERERVFMETTLKSALHSLISARRKVGECGNLSLVLEEEIKELAKKLAELQRSSSCKKKTTRRLLKEEAGTRPSTNFDKQATLLHKQLEEIGGLSNKQPTSNRRFDGVENLTRKMEGLSEGRLLKKMEDEYGPMLSTTTTTNTSASNSRRYDFLHLSSLQESVQVSQEKKPCEQKICAGQCKVIVRRMMEQVRAETEQWSQMQEMMEQVRAEMEQLQASRDFWQGRALDSDNKIQSLNSRKAVSVEIKQENAVYSLQEQLQRLRIAKGPKEATMKDATPHPQEKEKRVVACSVKGKIKAAESCRKREVVHDRMKVSHKGCSRLATPNRQPFQDIGNLSPLARQNGKR